MTERRLTLMAVHAHPDDEATTTGGVLARYASEGVRTVLVVCTDGGCGDGPGGVKPGEPGHDPAAVVELRRAELAASCATLQISDLELLGYPDSGMMGWATNDAPGSFWSTPVDEAAARLRDLIDHYRPDVVVTYDENGFYGHPDHIQAHRITMAALDLVARADPVPKAYWTTVPHSVMAEFERSVAEYEAEHGQDEATSTDDATPPEAEPGPEVGLPDDQISTWIDIVDFGRQKFDSLAAHASQTDNAFFVQLGLPRFLELMGVETFVRVRDTTGAPLPESDLFAGLR